jgi:hypothetical protein
MGWVIAILFGSAVVLLILSFFKTKQSKSAIEQQIEQVSFSIKDEVHELREQVRNIEIDEEITVQQLGALGGNLEERILLREMLNMQKRGYSFESIASEQQLTPNEVKRMLAPYTTKKLERSMGEQ